MEGGREGEIWHLAVILLATALERGEGREGMRQAERGGKRRGGGRERERAKGRGRERGRERETWHIAVIDRWQLRIVLKDVATCACARMCVCVYVRQLCACAKGEHGQDMYMYIDVY